MDRSELNLHESFERGIRNIYQIAAYIILVGNLLDMVKFAHENKILFYSNVFNIIIVSIFLAGYYLKRIPYRIGFSILIYSAIFNMYTGKFLSSINASDPFRIYFFLRDSLFIMFLIPLAAFSLHKIHAVIIGVSYLLLLLFFSIFVNHNFLDESAFLMVIVTVGFIGLTYYLVVLFEKAMLDQQVKSRMIQDQNEIVNEANRLLKERQAIIEKQDLAIKSQSTKLVGQAEELELKNEELVRLNDSRNLFFSIIAHDLKNPFSIILGYAGLLKDKYHSLTDEKRAHYIELIEASSVKTHNLLDNLLNWARSQTGSLKMKPEMFILNDTIQEVLDLYSENIRNKLLEVTYSPDLIYEVYADREMINTVIRNLMSNAIKFSFKEGRINIILNETEDFVQFSIKDSGLGISPTDMELIFDLDKHLTIPGTMGETGSGLGLILCKMFVEKNRGEIYVESLKNEGSLFSFTIPKNYY
jgi:two-component system, sensor histidine kinase and response regulator